MDVNKRNSALDITRIVALFSVIGVHFFLNSGYYSSPMLGSRMLVLTIARCGFMICVPLFLMLTGYLMNRKVWSKKYYLGIIKTLAVYLLASLACLIYKGCVLGQSFTLFSGTMHILNFSASNYAWYIEMYIGLFLLIPFLNTMWLGLDGKKARGALVVTLIVLTCVPTVLNIWNFTTDGWFLTPYLSKEYSKIMPSWWTMIYPFTYYFLGAYFREYPVKLNKRVNLMLLFVSVVISGMFSYYRSWGGFFDWGVYVDWYGAPVLIMSVIAFCLFATIDTGKFPIGIKKILAVISDACLGAYLVSFIFDDYVYTHLNTLVPKVLDRCYYFIPVTGAVFILSIALSCIFNLIYAFIVNLCKKIKKV